MANLVPPQLPTPPRRYDPEYFNEVVRAFSIYLEQALNPGEMRGTSMVLTQVPLHPEGLPPGAVWNEGGYLRIVDVDTALAIRPRGLVGNTAIGNVFIDSNVIEVVTDIVGLRAFAHAGTVGTDVVGAVSAPVGGVSANVHVGSVTVTSTGTLEVPVNTVNAARGLVRSVTVRYGTRTSVTGRRGATGFSGVSVQTTTGGTGPGDPGKAVGGFVESYPWPTIRPRPGATWINNNVPSRGAFMMPSPWNTKAYRITNAAQDALGNASDPFVGSYTFFRKINNHVNDPVLYFWCSARRSNSSSTTYDRLLYSLHKTTGQVTFLGSRYSSAHHGEFDQWHPTRPYDLIINDSRGTIKLHNMLEQTTVTLFDINSSAARSVFSQNGMSGGTFTTEKVHCNHDGTKWAGELIHNGNTRGTFWHNISDGQWKFFARASGTYDESQIDHSGDWIHVKNPYPDNRIIHVPTNTVHTMLDPNGAGGHSDMAFNGIVMADNWTHPCAYYLWQYSNLPFTSQAKGTLVYRANNWNYAAVEHNSFRHAVPPSVKPYNQQFFVGDHCSSSNNGPHTNEIISIPLDGSLRAVPVCDNLCNINASGGNLSWSNTYGKQPYATPDVTGRYIAFQSNLYSSRLEFLIVENPFHLLFE